MSEQSSLRAFDVKEATGDIANHYVDAEGLKRALRALGGGVSIITAGEGETRNGATVTSATALSIDPPRMIVTLNRSASTLPVVERYGHFCVNVAGPDHETLANQFAGRGGLKGAERYLGADWTRLVSGAPVLEDAAAAIDCEVEEVIERHSHAIVLGRVVGIRFGNRGSLVYRDGQYYALGG
ncbi:flavin reductase family protein [Sinorhizobium chiapasense]|uniref:Flavin reductase family protein n=1 Tax=Sinorhizobium chiapasense TaxID=501572 RepID=A0ABZ2BG12_9HYPH